MIHPFRFISPVRTAARLLSAILAGTSVSSASMVPNIVFFFANSPELANLAGKPESANLLSEMRKRTASTTTRFGGPLAPLRGTFFPSTIAHPEASATVSHKPDENGFVCLFNGKNLTGWKGESRFWSVEDGAITGRCDGSLKRNHFLAWKGSTIRNFDLRMKVKISAGGNSGIQYRSRSLPEIGPDVLTGYQCDVVANIPKYNGMLYEERGRRIIAHANEKVIIDPKGRPWVIGELPVKELKPGVWRDFRILARGNHLQHWIDGHPTADLIDLDEKNRCLEGVLAVQVHVGPAMTVQYKDIQIKHLPDDLPLIGADEVSIPADAYGVRPQGKLPKGWKPPVYGER